MSCVIVESEPKTWSPEEMELVQGRPFTTRPVHLGCDAHDMDFDNREVWSTDFHAMIAKPPGRWEQEHATPCEPTHYLMCGSRYFGDDLCGLECSRFGDYLCDFPTPGRKRKTCSMPLCGSCRVERGEFDYCPQHDEAMQRDVVASKKA